MKILLAYIRLIRLPNLLIIAATQYLMRYAVLDTLLKNTYVETEAGIIKVPDLSLQLSGFQFLCLVLATVFLTAAGYVINDYFDTKTDRMNRPEKVIVGRIISRRSAMTLHIVFNILGIIAGFYLSYSIGLLYLGFVFLLVSGLLWFYSTTYKRQFLIGNFLVALLTGLVPFMVVLFEIPVLLKVFQQTLVQYQVNLSNTVVWVGGFSFFAFLMNLIREWIKDMEDFEGDRAFGRKSLPVVLGLRGSKWVVGSFLVITVMALVLVYFIYIPDKITLAYMLIFLIAPLLFVLYRVYKATGTKDYHLLNRITKFVMIGGLAYSLVFRFLIVPQLHIA